MLAEWKAHNNGYYSLINLPDNSPAFAGSSKEVRLNSLQHADFDHDSWWLYVID